MAATGRTRSAAGSRRPARRRRRAPTAPRRCKRSSTAHRSERLSDRATDLSRAAAARRFTGGSPHRVARPTLLTKESATRDGKAIDYFLDLTAHGQSTMTVTVPGMRSNKLGNMDIDQLRGWAAFM